MARNTPQKTGNPLLPPAAKAAMVRFAWRAWGGLVAVFGLALYAALFSFNPADPALNTASDSAVQNWLHLPGAYAADLLLQMLGWAAWFVPLPVTAWGIRLVRLKPLPWIYANLAVWPLAGVLLAAALTALAGLGLVPVAQETAGGAVGLLIQQSLAQTLPPAFSAATPWIPVALFGLLFLAALPLTLGLDRAEWAALVRTAWQALAGAVRLAAAALKRLVTRRDVRGTGAKRPAKPRQPRTGKRTIAARKKPKKGRRASREAQPELGLGGPDGTVEFTLPALDLLARPKAGTAEQISEEALEKNARMLEEVLDDFGIKGEILNVRPGPVVTLYELEPAPGTKSSRVIGLADDIARSMSAVSARVAVVPGRNVIGIELPNARKETVLLREILEARNFERHTGRLPIALGKDIGGEPIIADLAGMPHLLVAGTTGSGKSVGLNAMIVSLLYRFKPQGCRFIMVDPKMLELSVYDGIPHLLTPVVTEPKKAVVALKWAVREMEERYQAMAKLGVRNISAYNEKVGEAQDKGQTITRRIQTGFDKDTGQPVYEKQEFDFEPLPLIVIVIDEMADLMLVAGKDVEATVQRLSQMARAAGIHLIMATQRPSVDVITGTIKANFPTRISYQVSSKIDSRTILGEPGAEQLLGQGDMLYMASGGRVTRVHGAFVSDDEVEDVAAHLKKAATPEYLAAVTEEPEEGFDSPFIPGGGDGDSDNELYDKAVAIVLRDRKASTSYIQRRLRIGYNRAATLIEEMENQGVISGPDHAGRREVLAPGGED